MKKLPIGIQSFEKIRTDAFYYVDKTAFVERLVQSGGGYFFLSRPRRFGKSLFLDTLRQAFWGRREFFEGLYLESHWEWSETHPVIRLSFGSGVVRSLEELRNSIESFLIDLKNEFGVCYEKKNLNDRFFEAIRKAADSSGKRVVVLIDEYDKPILDNIERPELALELREELKNLYSVLKDADEFLRFVFITGVTKFSKVSLFSGLNQLQDITLNPEYATVCGYTQRELESVFEDRLKGADLHKIRCWYNGYSWLGEPLYNPFDVLLHLSEGEFRPYWFETGTPSFLIRLMVEKRFFLPDLEGIEVSEKILGSFDLDLIEPENLLFQTGYLTIKGRYSISDRLIYRLDIPNKEVRISLNDHFLSYLTQNTIEAEKIKNTLSHSLVEGDLERVKETFWSFFASIPHDWYRKNDLAGYEGYYASVVYAYFSASGFEVSVEDATSKGRIDMVVLFGERVYVIEFKVVELEPEGVALEQIKEKRYWEKYLGKVREIYLIGVEFSKAERNITRFDWERVQAP